MTEQEAMFNTPLSVTERETASQVFSQYEGVDVVRAWIALRERALKTARPFRAYDCAHAIASKQQREETGITEAMLEAALMAEAAMPARERPVPGLAEMTREEAKYVLAEEAYLAELCD